jgi:hypothetical protein
VDDPLDKVRRSMKRNESASASRRVTQLMGVRTGGDPAVQLSSSRARVERFLIGSGMAALAWFLEKAVLRSMKKKGQQE